MSYNPFAGVQSFNGRQGVVVLTYSDATGALGFTPENAANRNAANGYAGLDSSGLIPAALLPSYVDDVLEYANLAAFPGTGETGKIYVALDTNKTYRWSGSAYVEISPSPGSTDSVTEGALNLYFTNTRARSAVATGLTFTGAVAFTQTAETVKNAAATLTAAEIRIGIINWTGAAATLTLPTGTALDSGLSGLVVDTAIDFSVINTGSGTVTIAVNTGITSLGSLTIVAGASGQFRLRKTATATYTLYRLS